MIYFQITVHSS